MPDATRKRASEAEIKDSDAIETLDAKPRIEFDIPHSKGDLADAAQPSPTNEAAAEQVQDEGRRAPGRTMDGEEAAARMAGIDLGAEANARANDLLGHLFEQGAAHGIRDEIDDATAARIAGQARTVNYLGHRRPEMLEARPVHRLPNLAEAPPDALVPLNPQPPAVGAGSAAQQAPRTALTVQQHQLPAFVDNEVSWLTIAQTPGYLQQMIRRFGREIFRRFPCFATHEQRAREVGHLDPLASIHLIANLGGQGRPSTARELDTVASWIRQNGTTIRTEQLEFPNAMPGYQPEIVLLVTQEESFLLVRERVELGAPANSSFVYRWDGGMAPYLEARGQAVIEGLAQAPALAPPPRAAAPRAVEHMRPLLDGAARHRTAEKRRARIAALPVAPSAVPPDASPVQKLIALGFTRHADQSGPALIATGADGTDFRISALAGRRLIDGDRFRFKASGPEGEEELDGLSVEEIETRFAASFPGPGAP